MSSVGGTGRISSNPWSGGSLNPAQQSEASNSNISAPTTRGPQTVQPNPTQTPPTKPATPQERPTISRAINQRDINQQLLSMGRPVTRENQEAMITLLRYGVEASSQNMDMVARLKTATRHPNGTESAVIAMSKGLNNAPRTVDALAGFLNRQGNISDKSNGLSNGISQFQSTIAAFQELFSAGLFTGLSGVLSELDLKLQKLNQRIQENGKFSMFDRSETLKEFQALLGFLKGTEEKVTAGRQNIGPLKEAFKELQGLTKGFIESVTAQAILSMDNEKAQMSLDEKFGYWQIPNPFGTKKDIDILIRKDPRPKKSKFDAQKTRIVLKFDTEDLGEVTVIMDILDKKIWYTFHVERHDTEKNIQEMQKELLERMEAQDYKTMGIHRVRRKADIKKMLLPTFDLNSISRVSAEI